MVARLAHSAQCPYRAIEWSWITQPLATVYRVLTQFEQAGILIRSNFESGKAVYELNEGQHHDHFVCTSCGKVEEFYDPDIEKRQNLIAKAKGWVIQDHSMALYGHCAECASRATK